MVNRLIRYTIYSVLMTLYLMWGFYAFKHPFWGNYEFTKCGVVTQTLNTERAMKYGMSDEFYIGVKYDDGTFVGENVSVTTFMSKKVGDRICLTKLNREEHFKSDHSLVFFVISGVVLLFLLGYYLIEIRGIFTENKE